MICYLISLLLGANLSFLKLLQKYLVIILPFQTTNPDEPFRHFPAFLTIFQIDYINIFNTITIAGIHRILLLTENTSNSLAGKWHGAKLSLKMSFET
jgi:hypothetical protein